MKKIPCTILLLFCFAINASCQNTKDFDVFLNYFPTIGLPYNTTNLNSEKQIVLIAKGKKINRDKCIKYLCQGNAEKVQYPYNIYQMEDGNVIDKGFKDYNFYPIGKKVYPNYIGLIYFKSGMYSTQYYYSLFSKDGNPKDTLLINKKIGETEYWEWQASYIEETKVTTYNYKANPDFLKQVRTITSDETIPRTIITIKSYTINHDTGKFELQKQETWYSKCSVDEFASGLENCKAEDPMSLLPK